MNQNQINFYRFWLLIDTAKSYRLGNRSVEVTDMQYNLSECVYDSDCGCAISRHVPREHRKEFEEGKSIDTSYNMAVIEKYAPKIAAIQEKIYVTSFLDMVQGLHDNGGHWDAAGLSEAGWKYLRNIMIIFCPYKIT